MVQLTLPTAAKSPMGVSVAMPPMVLLRLTFHTLPEPAVGTSAEASTVMSWYPCVVIFRWGGYVCATFKSREVEEALFVRILTYAILTYAILTCIGAYPSLFR